MEWSARSPGQTLLGCVGVALVDIQLRSGDNLASRSGTGADEASCRFQSGCLPEPRHEPILDGERLDWERTGSWVWSRWSCCRLMNSLPSSSLTLTAVWGSLLPAARCCSLLPTAARCCWRLSPVDARCCRCSCWRLEAAVVITWGGSQHTRPSGQSICVGVGAASPVANLKVVVLQSL